MLPLKGNKEMNFNSHAHVERDLLQRCNFKIYLLFQLTRSRGA